MLKKIKVGEKQAWRIGLHLQLVVFQLIPSFVKRLNEPIIKLNALKNEVGEKQACPDRLELTMSCF